MSKAHDKKGTAPKCTRRVCLGCFGGTVRGTWSGRKSLSLNLSLAFPTVLRELLIPRHKRELTVSHHYLHACMNYYNPSLKRLMVPLWIHICGIHVYLCQVSFSLYSGHSFHPPVPSHNLATDRVCRLISPKYNTKPRYPLATGNTETKTLGFLNDM